MPPKQQLSTGTLSAALKRKREPPTPHLSASAEVSPLTTIGAPRSQDKADIRVVTVPSRPTSQHHSLTAAKAPAKSQQAANVVPVHQGGLTDATTEDVSVQDNTRQLHVTSTPKSLAKTIHNLNATLTRMVTSNKQSAVREQAMLTELKVQSATLVEVSSGELLSAIQQVADIQLAAMAHAESEAALRRKEARQTHRLLRDISSSLETMASAGIKHVATTTATTKLAPAPAPRKRLTALPTLPLMYRAHHAKALRCKRSPPVQH